MIVNFLKKFKSLKWNLYENFFEIFEMKENLSFLSFSFPPFLSRFFNLAQPSSLLPPFSQLKINRLNHQLGPLLPPLPRGLLLPLPLFRQAQQGRWPNRRPSGSSPPARALLSVICCMCMLIYRISAELWKFCLFTVQILLVLLNSVTRAGRDGGTHK